MLRHRQSRKERLCSVGNNSCGGTSKLDGDPKAWIYVPQGYCERIATMRTPRLFKPSRAGIGLRLPHIAEMVAAQPQVGWLEIHPENFLANPHACALLVELSRTYPVSVHSVGISVGSATGIDRKHLERVRNLVSRIEAALVSGHLAWSSHDGEYLNDFLPLPFDEDTLETVPDTFTKFRRFWTSHMPSRTPPATWGSPPRR
jgi:hypothetical protein